MFSELSFITEETGLSFSGERTALYGVKCGFGIIVYDDGGRYRTEVFCERPFERESEIFPIISALGESLPKNTIISQSCEVGQIIVWLEKYNLLQENVEYLIEFLDKLANELSALGLSGREYRFPTVKKASEEPDKKLVKIKLGFDRRSIFGLLGSVLGAAAMTVIAVFLVNVKAEVNAFGLAFEVSAYIFSAVTTLVIFADYRFVSRKLDAFGIIICTVLSAASVVLSGFGAGAKACGQIAGVSFLEAVRGLPSYLAQNTDVDSFMMGYITRGLILSVLLSVLICIFYFTRHPEETVLTEKTIDPDSDDNGIIPRKRS